MRRAIAAILPAPIHCSARMIETQLENSRTSTALGFYGVAVLGTIGGALLTTGIFFYTHHRLGWGLEQNFRLAVVQGMVYTCGALLAAKVVARVPPRRALGMVHLAMATAAAVGAVVVSLSAGTSRGWVVLGPLLVYTFLSAIAWPILEGLVSAGGLDAMKLSRRLTTYNLVWSGTMAIVLAVDGILIQSGPAAVLAVPAAAHALAASWAFLGWSSRAPSPFAPELEVPGVGQRVADFDELSRVARLQLNESAEPELLQVRTVGLWLSRLALPATYVVVFGLMPMMPFLPVMQSLGTRAQTVVSSTWPAARWGAFAAFALGTWWHRRPRILLAAAWLMLVAFLAVTLRPTDLLTARFPPAFDLVWIVGWQAMLGMAFGVIYSGSLYFGMVLSDGSTEHGGYHEALIGTGWCLGPAAGAAAGWARPGQVGTGVAAIGLLIGLSVLATTAATIIAGRARGPGLGQMEND